MYRTILFAVEDDEALPAAIGAVAAYAGFWHAKVRVLHVHRIDPASRNGKTQYRHPFDVGRVGASKLSGLSGSGTRSSNAANAVAGRPTASTCRRARSRPWPSGSGREKTA
jgi:hypothetical protein